MTIESRRAFAPGRMVLEEEEEVPRRRVAGADGTDDPTPEETRARDAFGRLSLALWAIEHRRRREAREERRLLLIEYAVGLAGCLICLALGALLYIFG